MTGRRLYDHFTDAHRANVDTAYVGGVGWVPKEDKPAWPYLAKRDQKLWNDLARRITPKRPR